MPLNTKVDANIVLARVIEGGPDSLLSRGEAAALIALRTRGPLETDRAARNRAALMLDRAYARSNLLHHGGLPRQGDGRFKVDDVVYLVQCKFPDLFADLPCRPREVLAGLHDGFALGGSVEHEHTPGDLRECQALVDTLRAKLKQIRADTQQAEVDRKRELAKRLNGEK